MIDREISELNDEQDTINYDIAQLCEALGIACSGWTHITTIIGNDDTKEVRIDADIIVNALIESIKQEQQESRRLTERMMDLERERNLLHGQTITV